MVTSMITEADRETDANEMCQVLLKTGFVRSGQGYYNKHYRRDIMHHEMLGLFLLSNFVTSHVRS